MATKKAPIRTFGVYASEFDADADQRLWRQRGYSARRFRREIRADGLRETIYVLVVRKPWPERVAVKAGQP